MKHLLAILLGVAALVAAWPVAAHGGGTPRIVNRPLGPYTLSVWSSPEPLAAGVVHLTVALAQDDAPALDRRVEIVATPPSGAPIRAQATHEDAALALFYETDLTLPATGIWRFDVSVDGVAGVASFEATVGARSWLSSPWLAGGAVLVVALAWWLTRGRGGSDGR